MSKIPCTALAFVMADCCASYAAPLHAAPESRPPIVLAANGCGPAFFRTLAGDCVPNRMIRVGPGRAVVLPPPCPRGFLRDPNPARPLCYPAY